MLWPLTGGRRPPFSVCVLGLIYVPWGPHGVKEEVVDSGAPSCPDRARAHVPRAAEVRFRKSSGD